MFSNSFLYFIFYNLFIIITMEIIIIIIIIIITIIINLKNEKTKVVASRAAMEIPLNIIVAITNSDVIRKPCHQRF